jgi:hypothetical protein
LSLVAPGETAAAKAAEVTFVPREELSGPALGRQDLRDGGTTLEEVCVERMRSNPQQAKAQTNAEDNANQPVNGHSVSPK